MIIIRPLTLAGLTEMGMDKSGNYSTPGANGITKITGWTTRSGFPDTVITNNELVVNGDGNVTFQISITRSSTSGSTDNIRLYKNGAQVYATPNFGFTTGTTGSYTTDVVEGDSFSLYYQNGQFSVKTVTAGYLYYDVN